jgi:hypothetical protein
VRVRVEQVDAHRVAGITLDGLKLKRRVKPAEFYREANRMIDIALAQTDVEEADLRAFVPPARTVFTLTVRRADADLREPYWDPAWRAGLSASAANR